MLILLGGALIGVLVEAFVSKALRPAVQLRQVLSVHGRFTACTVGAAAGVGRHHRDHGQSRAHLSGEHARLGVVTGRSQNHHFLQRPRGGHHVAFYRRSTVAQHHGDATTGPRARQLLARRAQRAGLVHQLANLQPHPESVPINNLVQVEGTPLHGTESLDLLEFVRTIAVARITMPTARVRLSAGRQQMGEAIQALCFMAGANSIFYGCKLLTTPNPDGNADMALLAKLGLRTGQPVPLA